MKADSALESIIDDLANNQNDLVEFAYELRKTDTSDDLTFDLLNGRVRPSVLVEIILSNKWNPVLQRMVPASADTFRMLIGKNSML